VHEEIFRSLDLGQKPVLGIKEIPRTGSYEPVESHHCWWYWLLWNLCSVKW